MRTLTRLVIVLALAGLALWLITGALDSDMRAARQQREWARAREEQARADAAAAWSESWSDYADERAAALSWGLVALVAVAIGGGAGLAVVWLSDKWQRRRHVYPNRAGQFPVLQVSGQGWQGYIDPNRAPGHVTMIGDAPETVTPLALSEGAHLTIGQQASAVAAVAAASQGGAGTLGRPRLDVADMLGAAPDLGPAPLPDVIDVDPAHVDRLLALTGDDANEVLDL